MTIHVNEALASIRLALHGPTMFAFIRLRLCLRVCVFAFVSSSDSILLSAATNANLLLAFLKFLQVIKIKVSKKAEETRCLSGWING